MDTTPGLNPSSLRLGQLLNVVGGEKTLSAVELALPPARGVCVVGRQGGCRALVLSLAAAVTAAAMAIIADVRGQ